METVIPTNRIVLEIGGGVCQIPAKQGNVTSHEEDKSFWKTWSFSSINHLSPTTTEVFCLAPHKKEGSKAIQSTLTGINVKFHKNKQTTTI